MSTYICRSPRTIDGESIGKCHKIPRGLWHMYPEYMSDLKNMNETRWLDDLCLSLSSRSPTHNRRQRGERKREQRCSIVYWKELRRAFVCWQNVVVDGHLICSNVCSVIVAGIMSEGGSEWDHQLNRTVTASPFDAWMWNGSVSSITVHRCVEKWCWSTLSSTCEEKTCSCTAIVDLLQLFRAERNDTMMRVRLLRRVGPNRSFPHYSRASTHTHIAFFGLVCIFENQRTKTKLIGMDRQACFETWTRKTQMHHSSGAWMRSSSLSLVNLWSE